MKGWENWQRVGQLLTDQVQEWMDIRHHEQRDWCIAGNQTWLYRLPQSTVYFITQRLLIAQQVNRQQIQSL